MKKITTVIMCISNESMDRKHTLEMLSNGTIDGFILSVSEEAQNWLNTLMMAIPYSDV
jgi:LacI family transcriptional regulator